MAHQGTLKDKLILDLTYDDELKEYLERKEPGERCHLEVQAKVDELTETQAVLSVKEVIVHTYGDEAEPGDEKKMGAPPMLLMLEGKGLGKSPSGPEARRY